MKKDLYDSKNLVISPGKTYLDYRGTVITILCQCKYHYKTFIGESRYGFGTYTENGKSTSVDYGLGDLVKEVSHTTKWVVVYDTLKNEVFFSETEANNAAKNFESSYGRKVLKLFCTDRE